jgi:DNA-binding transcriptional regulator YhcF (GntR family)
MLAVDHESAVTLYEQLRTQIIDQVKSGELIAGAKLPTVRQLATDLGVAPYTVARVYRALEQDGFLETRGRNGTVVSASGDTAESTLQLAASDYATRARELGVPAADALRYVRSALGE